MKKKLLCCFVILILVSISYNGYAQQTEEYRFQGVYTEKLDLPYLIQYPKNFNKNQKYPLIVFLHGAGERGDSIALVNKHGPLKYVREGNSINAIILAPQCPKGKYWGDKNVNILPLVKHIIAQKVIDTNRVYLTGLSMGGYGTWNLAIEHPSMFAALVPICGPTFRTFPRNVCRIKHIPTWVVHGALDNVVNINQSSEMVRKLQECGAKPKYTIYPFADHNAWEAMYNSAKFYEWLLAQKKVK